MTQSALTVDVIMPCYNSAETLTKAAYSVLRQPLLRRLIIVDDGSTDTSADIIRNLRRSYPDKIHAVFLAENKGGAYAVNAGAVASDADIIAVCDSDDTWDKGVIERGLSVIDGHISVRLPVQFDGFPSRYTTHSLWPQLCRTFSLYINSNTMVWRSAFLAAGGFPTGGHNRLFDYDIALGNALLSIGNVAVIPADNGACVRHIYHDGCFVSRAMDNVMFGIDTFTDAAQHEKENAATIQRITGSVQRLKDLLTTETVGLTVMR